MVIDRRVPLSAALFAMAALAFAAALPVPPDRAALVLRLGQPVRLIDPAATGPAARASAGLAWHMPLVERVVWLDRRAQTTTTQGLGPHSAAIATRDGTALAIDGFAVWRVTDPVRFYQALGTPADADEAMRAMLMTVLRRQVAQSDLPAVLALVRAGGDAALRAGLDREIARYGATVVDLGLSRVTWPDGAPIDGAIATMTARADADAAAITAEGHRAASLIRADAEARAGQIYAASFGKDPEFYDFYRAMQSYDAAFVQKGNHATLVLSPDNTYLRQFRGK
ncbi:SPFH domain-containing protein [Novosphingobium sp.]|uniref:SPFH domain-containing protein n=1 Tax=Novosphingobium sp. TaxID=1874826 RepID=UPI003340A089